jgi:hypothetical protein
MIDIHCMLLKYLFGHLVPKVDLRSSQRVIYRTQRTFDEQLRSNFHPCNHYNKEKDNGKRL